MGSGTILIGEVFWSITSDVMTPWSTAEDAFGSGWDKKP